MYLFFNSFKIKIETIQKSTKVVICRCAYLYHRWLSIITWIYVIKTHKQTKSKDVREKVLLENHMIKPLADYVGMGAAVRH